MWESCFCPIWILLLREGSDWQESGPMISLKGLSWARLLSPAVTPWLTVCRTSCVLASGLAGRGSHSNLYSSSSRRWLLSCSWRTTVSFWSRPLPAAFQTLSAFSLQPPTVLSPAPDSASSLPLSVQDCASSLTTLVDAATGAFQSLSLTVGSLQLCFLMCFWKGHCRFRSLSLLLYP